MEAKKHREQAELLFSKKTTLNLLHQEVADNFYPERADFAYQRYTGMDMAAHLTTSYPIMVRRDLGNQFGTMLRPTETPWFHMSPLDPKLETVEAKRWLEWAENVQRRAMYDRVSLFTKATKEADHDYAAFGQAVLTARLNGKVDALLYRTWHLRDCAWAENDEGQIGTIYRKWKPHAVDLARKFKDKIDTKITEAADKQPFTEIECMHMCLERDMFDGPMTMDEKLSPEANKRRKERFPYVSVYYDLSNDKVIEAISVPNKEYVIPRWQTVSGSQYAFSPATVAALPDGRLIQAMTHTILEAGEKAVYPPMIATENVVRSDINLYAGGITWVDQEYDERLGAALKQAYEQDFKGMPVGRELIMDSRAILRSLFYLDKLSMPVNAPQMTAFEVGQRVQQYIRDAMPIFEPMEQEYNAALCEETFAILQRSGAFGSPDLMPKELRGADIQFRFKSPLHDAIEQQKAQKFLEVNSLIAQAINLDPASRFVFDAIKGLREAILGSGSPATWVRTDDEAKAMKDQADQAAQQQQLLANMQAGSQVAANLAGARKDLASAQPAQGAAPAGA